MPLTVQFQFVGLGSNTEKFALIVEARGALPPLDIGLGDEREDIGCRFYQRRVAPTVVVSIGIHRWR